MASALTAEASGEQGSVPGVVNGASGVLEFQLLSSSLRTTGAWPLAPEQLEGALHNQSFPASYCIFQRLRCCRRLLRLDSGQIRKSGSDDSARRQGA